jgi:hypothetical protein
LFRSQGHADDHGAAKETQERLMHYDAIKAAEEFYQRRFGTAAGS